MYSYEDRLRAVRLYIKLGKRVGLTLRQLGYPTKNAPKSWYREYEQRLELPAGYLRPPRYSQAHKAQAVGPTWSTAVASWPRSGRWAIPRGHCCPRGFKSCIRRNVRAPLVAPGNWRLKLGSLPSSPSACARQARRRWLMIWACLADRCTSGRISDSATRHPPP